MSSEHTFEQKGKVKPKPSQETAELKKDEAPLTKSQVQGDLDAGTLTRMQQTVGNAAVQRFLAQRQADGQADVDDETADGIRSKRGSGQAMDAGVADKAGKVMGQDFSDVNVHTDAKADQLSQQLGAKAFTTGNDIFFRSGAYNPGNSEGQRLISHELTHVVQQGASPPAVQGKMTVNDPDDQYENEADKVADVVMNHPEDADVQRQPIEEEEEMLQPKRDDAVQRQEEEEEMLQPKRDDAVQRQEEEEEMLQMQEEEEEMAQMQEEEEEEEEEPVQMQEELPEEEL